MAKDGLIQNLVYNVVWKHLITHQGEGDGEGSSIRLKQH